MNKAGNSCMIMSYEAGVMFIPRMITGSFCVQYCTQYKYLWPDSRGMGYWFRQSVDRKLKCPFFYSKGWREKINEQIINKLFMFRQGLFRRCRDEGSSGSQPKVPFALRPSSQTIRGKGQALAVRLPLVLRTNSKIQLQYFSNDEPRPPQRFSAGTNVFLYVMTFR